VQDPTAITTEFNTVKSSLDRFQTDYLKPRQPGRLEIINTVNALTKETGVRLVSPVQFVTDIPGVESENGGKANTSGRKVARKSAVEADAIHTYPSLGMQFSIAGEYPALRAFINKFEGSNQFAVIDSVALSSEGDHKTGKNGRGHAAVAPTVDIPPGQVTLTIAVTGFFQPDPEAARMYAATER